LQIFFTFAFHYDSSK